jgi:cytochrome c
MRITALSLLLLVAWPATTCAQSVEDGAEVFKKCRACHQVGEAAKNVVGPKLNGLFGRKAGSIEGFSYSDANKGSGVVWDEKAFANYIKDPKAAMPGNKMAFAGIKDERDISDLVAYLKTFSADGKQQK